MLDSKPVNAAGALPPHVARGLERPVVFAIVDEKQWKVIQIVHSTIRFVRDQEILSRKQYDLCVQYGVKLRNRHRSVYSFRDEILDILRGAELTKAEANEIAVAARECVPSKTTVTT
ncbi:MAG TPA: hypothetical protein VGF98_04985 [Candidatus Tumulicola sp.]|jgi:hypothetical protein